VRGARIREKLDRGGVVLNVMVPFHSPAVVEMLGLAGVDMVLLDAEHGAIDEGMCEHMVRAADVVDLPAIVRTPRNDAPTILRYLDLGASGVMPPHIATVDDARRAVEAAKYGPQGKRSYGGPRAGMFGARESAQDYVRRANHETLVVGLFEDVEGIDQIDEIFAVDGLDALCVGPNDLAFSMGYPAQPWHPEVQRVVDRVIEASKRSGKATGLPATDLDQARAHVARGCRIISVGAGAILMNGARTLQAGLTTRA
jgi:2-keto-3-deoxy-L-rhamnonate aldolase RhmA